MLRWPHRHHLLHPKVGEEVEALEWNRSSCKEWAGAAGEHPAEGGWQSEVLHSNGKEAGSFTLEIVFV